ncbi:prepilin peptidase [Patescibacteria group bacterium]|nr:prepilin peptidase [Patescibacteria group bacterium]
MIIIIFVLGLILGSFAGALSYRMPRNVSISRGRSYCPNCKSSIHWYDNIPVISYLLLRGQCRHCHHKISPRYPIIEISTALLFMAIYVFRVSIVSSLPWPVMLAIAFLLVVIFVIDWEHQIIPDELVFIGITLVFVSFVVTDFDKFFIHIFAGFTASLFLLTIHLLTKGRGMGLGDVKLAILLGMILGPLGIYWMFASFILGGFVGLILLLSKKAQLADRIAFGPFLIVGFLIALFPAPRFLEFCKMLMC